MYGKYQARYPKRPSESRESRALREAATALGEVRADLARLDRALGTGANRRRQTPPSGSINLREADRRTVEDARQRGLNIEHLRS